MRMPPIHPLLFAAYPILFLWSSNIGSVRTEEIIIPILVSVGIALGLWQGLRIGFGWDMRRVGIWVSYVIFMCFSHWIFEAAASFVIYGKEKIVSNYYFFPFWCFILILGTLWIARTRKNLDTLTTALNVMSCCLVTVSILSLFFAFTHAPGISFTHAKAWPNVIEHDSKQINLAELRKQSTRPDIYYIILDAYGRADVLKDLYNYDNSQFVDWLNQKGFYVARESKLIIARLLFRWHHP